MEAHESPSNFEPIWQAAADWLPAASSPAYRRGLAGDMVRRANSSLLASSLTHLLIPGLAALGVEARLTALSEQEQERRTPSDSIHLLIGFATPLGFIPPEEINDATPLPTATDPSITAQQLRPERIADDHSKGDMASDRVDCTYLLTLRRGETKPLRRESVQAALHRWLAWHAAYPEHAPREEDLQDPACALAAAFLSEVIGTRRDFVSNRLRYAARSFEAAQIASGYSWLLEAGIALWQLPAAAANALLTAPASPLSETLRQELIYLARAGALPLKALAARRLTHERHHPDARKTLHQLRFDADPWIRAASRPTAGE